MTQNKDMIIEALVGLFGQPVTHMGYCVIGIGDARENTKLIRDACENIYQQGLLQGKYEALEESLKSFKGEVI